MHSLLASIRKRAVTLGTGPNSTMGARDASVNDIATFASQPSGSATLHEHFLPKKIHPDVNSLLERYSADEGNRAASVSSHGTGALSARASSAYRQRRHSIDSPPLTIPQLDSLAEKNEDDSETRAQEHADFVAHHRQLTASSEWATFGRINKVTSEERMNAPRPRSSFHNTPSSDTSGVLQPFGNRQLLSKTSSDLSIPRTNHASYSPASRRTSQNENPWMAPQYTSTPRSSVTNTQQHGSNMLREFTASTPHTFGQPTPPQSHLSCESSLKEFGLLSSVRTAQSEWFDDPPPPPLPPLDHPAFAERERQKANPLLDTTNAPAFSSPTSIFSPGLPSHGRLPVSSSRYQQHRAFRSVPSLALKHHHRHKSSQSSSRIRSSQTSSKVSLPARLEKASISAPSHIDSPSVLSLGTKFRGRSRSIRRRRAQSGESEDTSTRRSSAEWSAHHAYACRGPGVTNAEEWPALVSREILRISGVLPPATDIGADQDLHGNANQSEPFASRLVFSSGTDPDSGAAVSATTSRFAFPMTITSKNSEAGLASSSKYRKGKGKSRASGTPSVDSIKKGFPSLDDSLGGGSPRSIAFNIPEDTNLPVETPQRGKRKVDDAGHGYSPDGTPPEQKKPTIRATSFAADVKDNHRHGSLSRPPSSYRRKRARLSFTGGSQDLSRNGPDSVDSHTAAPRPPSRAASQAASAHSHNTSSVHTPHNRPSSRRSMSQASIPISALLSPHAPSISRSSTFHMRDPRRPPKKLARTGWGLEFGDEYEMGSPVHAWAFFVGFVLFPVWWGAAVWRIPETRRLSGGDQEKAVWVDDPQIEQDAKSWRFRCRVMSAVSLVTYIPFIVLVAIFASR